MQLAAHGTGTAAVPGNQAPTAAATSAAVTPAVSMADARPAAQVFATSTAVGTCAPVAPAAPAAAAGGVGAAFAAYAAVCSAAKSPFSAFAPASGGAVKPVTDSGVLSSIAPVAAAAAAEAPAADGVHAPIPVFTMPVYVGGALGAGPAGAAGPQPAVDAALVPDAAAGPAGSDATDGDTMSISTAATDEGTAAGAAEAAAAGVMVTVTALPTYVDTSQEEIR